MEKFSAKLMRRPKRKTSPWRTQGSLLILLTGWMFNFYEQKYSNKGFDILINFPLVVSENNIESTLALREVTCCNILQGWSHKILLSLTKRRIKIFLFHAFYSFLCRSSTHLQSEWLAIRNFYHLSNNIHHISQSLQRSLIHVRLTVEK